MPRIALVGLIWLLVGSVVLVLAGGVALLFDRAEVGLGSRLLQTLFLLTFAAALPSLALICLIERIAQRAGLVESDVLELMVARLRGVRQPVEPAWTELPRLSVVSYSAYLDSDAWRRKRRFKLAQVGFRCQVCNTPHRLEVHHRTYERVGREQLDDLTVLCRDCHRLFHVRSLASPMTPVT